MIERQDDINYTQDEADDLSFVTPDLDTSDSGLEGMRNTARRKQRWLLALVVTGGIAAVLGLKYIGGGVEEVQADTVVEQLIEHFISDSKHVEEAVHDNSVQSDHALQVLQETYQRQQVPVTDLRSNPFIALYDLPGQNPGNAGSMDSIEVQRNRRLEELESIVMDLDIDSTLTGARPMARISGELVLEGNTLIGTPTGVVITLTSVSRDGVTLEAIDESMNLTGQWHRTVGR